MREKYILGKRFINNEGLEYEIVGYIYDEQGKKIKRKIRFLKSGYQVDVVTNAILSGAIHDYLHPGVCGIGIMDIRGGENHPLKKRWENMIRRCYDKNHIDYKTYGGRGVYVCNEWLKFSNYIKDVEAKKFYVNLLNDSKGWHLDKDLLGEESKCYSNDTTRIISSYANNMERINRHGNPNGTRAILQYSLDGEFIKKHESIRDAERDTGARNSDITRCCKGKRNKCGGFKWKYDDEPISNKGKILVAEPYIESEIEKLKETIHNLEVTPKIKIIRVGEDEASKKYVNNKIKMSNKIGINIELKIFKNDISESELIDYIKQINEDDDIHGMLVQLPLPEHISEENVINSIDPRKDVDCFSSENIGKMVIGNSNIYPCTPFGILSLMEYYNIKIEGKNVVIINRSNIIGKPLFHMLLDKNATVTVAHSKTEDLKLIVKEADIIITATGRPSMFNKYDFKKRATIIDVSINFDENGKMCGDIKKTDYDALIEKGCSITPVPGGIGPTTVLSLMKNAITLAENITKEKK